LQVAHSGERQAATQDEPAATAFTDAHCAEFEQAMAESDLSASVAAQLPPFPDPQAVAAVSAAVSEDQVAASAPVPKPVAELQPISLACGPNMIEEEVLPVPMESDLEHGTPRAVTSAAESSPMHTPAF